MEGDRGTVFRFREIGCVGVGGMDIDPVPPRGILASGIRVMKVCPDTLGPLHF